MFFDDDLPVYGFVGKLEHSHAHGLKDGLAGEARVYLFTHFHFDIAYNGDQARVRALACGPWLKGWLGRAFFWLGRPACLLGRGAAFFCSLAAAVTSALNNHNDHNNPTNNTKPKQTGHRAQRVDRVGRPQQDARHHRRRLGRPPSALQLLYKMGRDRPAV